MRYRLRTLLIVTGLSPVLFAPLSATFLMLPLCESDRVDSAKVLIAWLVDGRPIPGFDELPVNGDITRKKSSFVVVCNFIEAQTPLSSDTRVRMVSRPEPFSLNRDESVGRIEIAVVSESRWLLALKSRMITAGTRALNVIDLCSAGRCGAYADVANYFGISNAWISKKWASWSIDDNREDAAV